MKIISKFKDYYDYVQHVYGGGDPKIVYDRRRLGEQTAYGTVTTLEVKMLKNEWSKMYFPFDKVYGFDAYDGYSCADWLVVCGKPFPLIPIAKRDGSSMTLNGLSTYNCDWAVYDQVKHASLVKHTRSWLTSGVPTTGVERPQLVTLSRMIGHPVFRIVRTHSHKDVTITVDGNCPILSDLGLASIYPAEQIYQDLSYFIVNRMKLSPDMQPPTAMTDREKILQHGFDTKQSFRHRK